MYVCLCRLTEEKHFVVCTLLVVMLWMTSIEFKTAIGYAMDDISNLKLL